MPLVRFLDNHSFGPEAITAMTAAFEDTLRTLGLVDHIGLAAEIVAKIVIELARQGECRSYSFARPRCTISVGVRPPQLAPFGWAAEPVAAMMRAWSVRLAPG